MNYYLNQRTRYEIERALAQRHELRAEVTPIREGKLVGLRALEIDSRDPKTEAHTWIAKIEGDAAQIADALIEYAEIVRKWG